MSLTSIGKRLNSLVQLGLVARDKQGAGPLAARFGGGKAQTAASGAPAAVASSAPVALNEAQSHSRWFRSERSLAAAEIDPAYAKQAAEFLAFTPDKMTLNWADAPSPRNVDAWNAWVNPSVAFDKEAEPVTAERIELYNSLKTAGTPDVDILKAMINFNGTRPIDYQIKTGFWTLDVTA